MVQAIILTTAAIVIGAVVGIVGMASDRQQEAPTVRVLYCALAIPPLQVVRTPRLEPVYCRSSIYGHCDIELGWIVVSEPVPCE